MFVALSARHFYHSAFRKFFENTILLAAICVSLGIICMVLFIPTLNTLFKTAPLTWMELGMVVLFSSGVLWAEEIRKMVMKRNLR